MLEVVLDKSEITEEETLSIVSAHGVRDIYSYLQDKSCDEILLERWKVEYSPTIPKPDQEFYHLVPKIFKQCIIHFRALYTITSLLPTWRLWSQMKTDRGPKNHLAIRCKVGPFREEDNDMLSNPIYDGDSYPVVDQVVLDQIQTPLGSLSTQVTYRRECKFFLRSSNGLGATMSLSQGDWNLDQEYEIQPRQLQRKIRSNSLPGRVLGSDKSSLRQRSRTFSTFDNANTKDKLFNHVLSSPGNISRDQNAMSLPISGRSQLLAPGTDLRKTHKCPHCETTFSRFHNFKIHILTHSQARPYVCQTCTMRFRRLHDLKRHTKLHTGNDRIFVLNVIGNLPGLRRLHGTAKDPVAVPGGQLTLEVLLVTIVLKDLARGKIKKVEWAVLFITNLPSQRVAVRQIQETKLVEAGDDALQPIVMHLRDGAAHRHPCRIYP